MAYHLSVVEILDEINQQDTPPSLNPHTPQMTITQQDHRNIKCRIRLMLGFKSFRRAQTILAGIELIHMIRKGQYQHPAGDVISPAEQFSLLAA